MAGIFACPECGQELEVGDLTPGREVQCEECSAWVEVPFLPRASGWKRGRRSVARPAWKSKLLRGSILFAAVALLGLMGVKMIGGRVRSGKEQVLAELLASVDEAETARRYDTAFREIVAALAQARTMGLEGTGRLDELEARRDRISVREAEAGLATVDALGPDEAVAESSRIAERARRDDALAPLAGTIQAKLDESRRRQAEADLAIARQAFDSGQDAEAFEAAARLSDRAGLLPSTDARRFEGEGQRLIEAAVARSGVAIPPVVGRFVAGSAETYTAKLDSFRADAARMHGYLPQPRRSPWAKVWDEKAPFRSTIQVVETQEELYLQSKNRTTQVDGTFELTHGNRVIWQNRVVTRTRMPLPGLTAYLAGHLATSARRDPEAERRLHDDAFLQFVEQGMKYLRGIPTRETAMRTR